MLEMRPLGTSRDLPDWVMLLIGLAGVLGPLSAGLDRGKPAPA